MSGSVAEQVAGIPVGADVEVSGPGTGAYAGRTFRLVDHDRAGHAVVVPAGVTDEVFLPRSSTAYTIVGRDYAAEVLDTVLAGQQVRRHDWSQVTWRRSVDDPGLLAAWAHPADAASVEVAWLDGDGRLSVIDPDGNVRDTGIVVPDPIVVDDAD